LGGWIPTNAKPLKRHIVSTESDSLPLTEGFFSFFESRPRTLDENIIVADGAPDRQGI
jgi:hypothetical protein